MSAERLAERDGEMGEDSLAYTLTSPVDLDALGGHLGGLPLVLEGSLASASDDEPVTLWVLGGDLDDHAVRDGVTAAQEVEAPDESDQGLVALRAKARAGEDLTSTEVQTALRLLLTGR